MPQTYSREQRRNIAIAQRLSRGHSRRVVVALLEAMAVESNFRHLPYGDRDSLGVLQQRPSQGWGPYKRDPSEDIQQFLSRASALDRRGFKGTPGQLAQAVQRSAFPGRYDERAAEVNRLIGGAVRPSAGQVAATRGGVPPAGAPPASGANIGDISAPDTSALRQQFALSLAGGQASRGGQGLQQELLGLFQGLSAARSAAAAAPSRTTVILGQPAAATQAPARQATRAFTGFPGEVIGTPHAGTHTIGNWQSDNAIDVAMKVGTPIRAPEDGVIGSRIGSLGKSGRFAGQRVYLNGSDEHYFAHLSRLAVKPGQRVRAGQIIGYSGMANGVAHLHYGRRRGDPHEYARR